MKITIEDLQPHLDRCRKELDAERSGIMGDAQAEAIGVGLNKEGSVRRAWQNFNYSDVYLFKAFLDFYTDAKNAGDDGSLASYYVTDPVVGDSNNRKIVAPGTYRNAFTVVRKQADDKYMLVQELRLGWIEQLVVDGEVDYSEARVETIDWFTPDEPAKEQNYITLVWKGVSPYHANAIVESLEELPTEDWEPVVNGNTLKSHRRLLIRSQEEQDGSASVRVLLANSVVTFEAYGSWRTERQAKIMYYFSVPTDMVNSILELERVNGAVSRISPPDGRGLHDISIEISDPEEEGYLALRVTQNCSTSVYTDVYLGLSKDEAFDIELPNNEGVPINTPGVTWVLRRQSRGDGFWDVIVEKRVREYQEHEYVSESAAGFKETTKIQSGVTDEEVEDIDPYERDEDGNIVLDGDGNPVVVRGRVVRRNVRLNDD
jgi:ketosteroid isomerase-like protein